MRRLLVLLVLLLVIFGCGGNDLPGNIDDFDTVVTATLVVGVIAPLEGGLTSFGRGILNSVQLAVGQANRNQTIPNVHLIVDARDDSSDPAVGARAAAELARNDSVVGVIGTYNSGVAFQTAPILLGANIVQISPANTDPTLTQPVRQFANYFRLVVPDSVQGPFLARRAIDLGFGRAAVVTESKSVSQGLANAFSQEFVRLGGTVTTTQVVPEGTSDYVPFLTAAQATNPDLLFYGGEYQTAIPVRTQARGIGLDVPLMGGDGVKDELYIAGAGALAEGDFASTVGAPIDRLPGGAQFARDYAAAGFAEPATDFGPFAYDATNVLIEALRQALNGTNTFTRATRDVVLPNVQAINLQGVTGPVAFDANGDPVNQLLTLYQVQNGVWVPVR